MGQAGQANQDKDGVAWWREPTREQWLTFLAAWSGWVLDAFDFTVFLLVMPSIAKQFGVPLTAAAGTITLTLLMRLLGGFAAGWLADRVGRKLPLVISVAWFAVCDGGIAFAPSFAWVVALRVLFGFGMGAQWTAGTAMAMESWPEKSRGIASGILQGSWAIGYLAAARVTSLVMTHSHHGFRALFLIAAVPALLVLPLQLRASEGGVGKGGAAGAAARRAAGGGTLKDLFAPQMRTRLLWATGSMAIGLAAYYAFTGLYASMLQTEQKLPIDGAMSLVSIFNVAMLAGSVAFGAIAKRYGIRAAVVVPALLMVPLLPLYVGARPDLLWVGAIAGGGIGVGWAGTVPVYLTGLFPARVRAKAIGLVYHAGAFFAALVPPATTGFAGLLARRFGVAAPLAWSIGIIAGGCLLSLSLLLLVQPRELFLASADEGAEPHAETEATAAVSAHDSTRRSDPEMGAGSAAA